MPFVRYSTAIHFSVRKLAVPFVKSSVFLFSVRELAMAFVKSSTVIHFSVRKLAVPFRLTIKNNKTDGKFHRKDSFLTPKPRTNVVHSVSDFRNIY